MAESAAPAAAAAPPRVCAVCAAEAVEQCVRCKVTAYCSRRCQKRHWSRGRRKYRCFSPEARAKRAAFELQQHQDRVMQKVAAKCPKLKPPTGSFGVHTGWVGGDT